MCSKLIIKATERCTMLSSYRQQLIHLNNKSIDWFLCDGNIGPCSFALIVNFEYNTWLMSWIYSKLIRKATGSYGSIYDVLFCKYLNTFTGSWNPKWDFVFAVEKMGVKWNETRFCFVFWPTIFVFMKYSHA